MGAVELKHGMFAWVDLMAHDADTARDWYSKLFGWRPEVLHPGAAYTLFFQGDDLIAGLGEASPEMKEQGAPAVWHSYVLVDDVDALAARVPELGGAVVMGPMDVMDAGRMCVVRDPSGGHVCLWQAGTHRGATFFNEPNALAWNELITRDPAAARTFFAELLGWSYDEMQIPDFGTYHVVKVGDRPNGGMCTPPGLPDFVPPYWDVYIAVDDVDAMAARAAEMGARILAGPMDISVGRYAGIRDPQGAVFSIFKPAPMPE